MISYIKVSKNPETSRSFENNILSRAVQSNFEVNIAQVFITVVAESSRISCSIAEERRETYERLSQRPQTLMNAQNFLVELKPLFDESFQGSRKQFHSKRLVMSRTDVYVTADLYQTKRQDKPRIV